MNFANLRIGIGHDTHRLKPGGPLLIGGTEIPFDKSLVGHSDADVLLHAITDAVLGAASLGDIGELFPDTSDENKNRSSTDMLQRAMKRVRESGLELINIDCIIFAQRPKLASVKLRMAETISTVLAVNANQVNVKAKTGEGIGDVGNENCMMAQCVALMYLKDTNE